MLKFSFRYRWNVAINNASMGCTKLPISIVMPVWVRRDLSASLCSVG